METKRFCFSGNIQGRQKDFIVKAPVENGGVYTNKYCPQDLLTGGVSFIKAVNIFEVFKFLSNESFNCNID